MANMDTLFYAIDRLMKARKDAHENYAADRVKYEAMKGSDYYNEQMKQAAQKRDTTIREEKARCFDVVNATLKRMQDAIKTQKMLPPTEEQLRILQTLKMRDKVSSDELDAAANAMDGTGSGLAVIAEIAQKNGHLDWNKYHAMTTDALPVSVAQELLKNVADISRAIINNDSGRDRAALLAHNYHVEHYGGSRSVEHLPAEKMSTSPSDFCDRNFCYSYEMMSKTLG